MSAPLSTVRRADCPWCGGRRLRSRSAVLDRCQECAHVFRNPRVAVGGRRVRDRPRRYRATVRAVLRLRRPDPESWLDVGTGDAGFPAAARAFFPYTAFDGLDVSPRVLRARAAERIEEAHLGRLTDPHVTAPLRSRYDVVSLLDHLPHTPTPQADLIAALALLRPGGLLILELPTPTNWRPPPPPPNITTALTTQGCTLLFPTPHSLLSPTYHLLAHTPHPN
ncbi:class I SAM-dependent methyltransferase [Streptomyces sp. NPDC087425]|uniref:class I SAM-dependent methyltransferase n=1 Tax=unclassified Streptomyces TaxID=2593676 RepID=UPI00381C965F